MVKTDNHDSMTAGDSSTGLFGSFQKFLGLMTLLAAAASIGVNVHGASSQPTPASDAVVEVFALADETATLIETVRDGASLTPMAEMMGIHQLGGAAAAIGGGWVRVHFGDYQNAFLIGGCLGLVAACLALTVDRRGIARPELRTAPELAGA